MSPCRSSFIFSLDKVSSVMKNSCAVLYFFLAILLEMESVGKFYFLEILLSLAFDKDELSDTDFKSVKLDLTNVNWLS